MSSLAELPSCMPHQSPQVSSRRQFLLLDFGKNAGGVAAFLSFHSEWTGRIVWRRSLTPADLCPDLWAFCICETLKHINIAVH